MTATKGNYYATPTWVDLTTQMSGIANVAITITGHNTAPCEVFFGGASAPTLKGEVVEIGDVLSGVISDHIWVRALQSGASIHVVTN